MNQSSNYVSQAHASSIEDVFKAYNTTDAGISSKELADRQQTYGLNALPLPSPTPAWKRFLLQIKNVLIYILLGSAFISLLLQHYIDAGVIALVVVINAIVGFVQEGKAEQALQAIKSMSKTHTLVVRDGSMLSVESSMIFPGDVVVIQAGDRVPADVRLFYCKDFRCDESPLTGESHAVSKQADAIEQAAPLAERTNMAFMGTMVTSGMARGVVCATGVDTQIGQISEMVQHTELPKTPLQIQLEQFAKQLSMGIGIVSVFVLLFGFFVKGYPLQDMFQAAIGILVASIPEGLPAIVTIALAIGVMRMAKQNALVRRLASVEVLGAVDIICSDKTGTLTMNAMTARELIVAGHAFKVTGEGYSPSGTIVDEANESNIPPLAQNSINLACHVALLCNDANIREHEGEWELHGDPTEGALLALAMKHGLVPASVRHDWGKTDELPFDSDRRYMATLHHNPEGSKFLAIKGAPDRLMSFSHFQQGENGPEPLDHDYWHAAITHMAERGMRVMALAYRSVEDSGELSQAMIERDVTLIGLVGISDPPRPEAIASIVDCQSAGIRVKMITGDSPITAGAIGRELGLRAERVVTGSELDAMDADTFAETAEQVDIFARTSPANKLQLVQALRARQHVVSMTGDGVNDAPALRQADIGVAMGKKGTEAAKEASDIVLTDDLFSTIRLAVAEGRTVYDNIVKSIVFVLPTNMAQALVIIIAIFAGRLLPITPAQILWVNMVTAITLALALAFEPPEQGVMERKPRKRMQSLITLPLLGRMLLVGVYSALTVYWLFSHARNAGVDIDQARTIAVNALVTIEAFYLLNCRFLHSHIFHRSFLNGILPTVIALLAIAVFQLLLTYFGLFQAVFGTAPIGLGSWAMIFTAAVPILFIVEVEKLIWRSVS
ncbi:cation-translocating P-type ATPase [Reinekea marinisedimentorum]|uniref:Calcium-translocating P-type ATPase n=1 Tax=Reinekea marinisedimentorum TaxID=230495 RepID=A0A4R3IAK1_9GAMM|nr:HAD-IC family P-type ATPase [Reinekea marinisedimentorum]TCS42519.1 calcium-translocating P-type ATPase [Reinekea marinisedimentorum]